MLADGVALATVVETWGSAPRPVGSNLVIDNEGNFLGSVSGGCVEGAVYELAESVVGTGEPVLERYGVSDDDAFAVGLTCGGILDVFVEKVSRETFPELEEVAADIEAGRPVALATVIEHPDPAWLGRRLVVRPTPIVRDENVVNQAQEQQSRHGLSRSLGSRRADDAVHDDARVLPHQQHRDPDHDLRVVGSRHL